jgi:hypothetical protein
MLPPAQWRERRLAHQRRVDGWLSDHLARRRRGAKHPVLDFLFTYYSCRPAQLRRWHPGAGLALEGADPAEFGAGYVAEGGAVALDVDASLARRRAVAEWVRHLLRSTAGRPPRLGCFGLHEWAMVYGQGQPETRHHTMPLRLGVDGTAAVVEELPIRCSHFDAYRFFTPAARPRNELHPTRQAQAEWEQPGCLHANMDLYKWAYKLSPLVPSELVADCFAFAREIRTLDMRASPYDLTELGYSPVRVETAEGRKDYVQAQQSFAQRATPLRSRLIAECDRLLAASDG